APRRAASHAARPGHGLPQRIAGDRAAGLGDADTAPGNSRDLAAGPYCGCGRLRLPGRDVSLMPARELVRFTTYNLLNLFAADTAEDRQHYQTITGVIRALDADVLAVQEILAPDAATAAERLRRLADDAGMRCEVPGSAGSADPSGASGRSAAGAGAG